MAMSRIVCLQNTLEIFRFYAMFPEKNKELNPGKYFYFKFAVLACFSSIILIGSSLHLIKSISANNYTSLDSDLMYTLSLGATFLFSIAMVYKTEALVELFMFLSDFEEFGKPIDFDKDNKFYDKLSVYHYIYLETLVSGIVIISTYLNTNKCKKLNLEYGLDEICGLFSYTWMPFDIDYFPVKQILLVVQLFGAHHFYMIAGMCAWFVVETIQHVRIRIRHVNYLFQEAIQEEDSLKCREKFNKAVRYHSSLLDLGDKMNGAFGIFMFNHMAITAPIIGTGVFAIVSGGSISSFLVCLGWFGGLTMDCFAGQWLQDEASSYIGFLVMMSLCFSVGTDLYDADWFHCSDDMKKDIMMVIRRSWTPIYLRASSFGIMDYRMFLVVLKASYSYITLLTQT